MPREHSEVIAAAARMHLGSIGMVQKGRSRVWLDDQNWYVGIVEFQPSSYSTGSYLNVGLHFLWSYHDSLSFDSGFLRKQTLTETHDIAKFDNEINHLAKLAAKEIVTFRSQFGTLMSARENLPKTDQVGDWNCFHKAIICGLQGDLDTARTYFDQLTNSVMMSEWEKVRADVARKLNEALSSSNAFRLEIESMITKHRKTLKLPTAQSRF